MKKNYSLSTGAITLIDILGWKGIWQKNLRAAEVLNQIIDDAKTAVTQKPDEDFNEIFQDLSIEIISISDTIAIGSIGTPLKTLQAHAFIINSIIITCLSQSLFIRGATSYGGFSIKNNIIIGPAVDEVAAWYDTANWIGVFQTPSAFYRINLSEYEYPELLIEYDVMLKHLGKFKTYCNNWTRWFLKVKKKNEEDLLKEFLKSMPILPDVAMKYANTLDFFRYARNELKKSQNNIS